MLQEGIKKSHLEQNSKKKKIIKLASIAFEKLRS